MLFSMLSLRSGDLAARLKKLPARARGLTLIETLLAIAVGAGVIIAAVAFFINAGSNSRANDALNQVQGIIGGVRSYYQSTNSYTGLTNTVATRARIFPSNMVDGSGSGATVFNPWKGNVTLASPSAATFTLTYETVPQDACVKLVSTTRVGTDTNISQISVNGTAITTPGNVTPDVASDNCTEDANELIWTAR